MEERELTKEELEKATFILSDYTHSLTTNGETIEIADINGETIVGEVSISILDNIFKASNNDITFK